MAKKGTKFQVVDLGTHFVKAAQIEAQGGSFPITSAAAVPLRGLSTDAEGHLSEIRAGFEELADFFDRKIPIYFVVPETFVRVGISYLNNIASEAVEGMLASEAQKFQNSSGIAQYDLTTARSFRLREKSQGKNVQIVAANVLAKNEDLTALAEQVTSRKLALGGFFPRLFAQHALFKICFGESANNAVACLVDIGYTSTSMIAFKDRNIVFHKVLHLGGVDIYKELVELETKGNFKIELPEFGQIMATQGFGESDANLTAMRLPLSNPAKYVEAILGQADQLFTKVQLSIDYFSTVAATDFNTSMSTVMAVRKGPELIVFTGGVARCERFAELAVQYFGKGAVILDPGSAGPMTGPCAKTELDGHFFHTCVGGAALAADEGAAEYSLGGQIKTGGAGAKGAAGFGGAAEGGGPEPLVPSWAGLLFVVVVVGLGYWWWDLSKTVKLLQGDLGSKQLQLAQAVDIIKDYRTARTAEYLARTRLEFIEEMLKGRVPWPRFFQDLQTALPEDVKIFRLTVDTQLPEAEASNDPTSAGQIRLKAVTFKICGEALNRGSVGEFVNRLLKSKRFANIAPPDIVLAGEGTGTPQGPCQDPESPTVKLQKHFAFQISGKLTY